MPRPRKGPKKLRLDYETYCDLDIRDVGAYRYAMHPSCEVLLASYRVDNGKTKQWDATAEAMPLDLLDALKTADEIHAFNAPFERLITTHVLGIERPIPAYRCTLVHSYSLGFTGNLEMVGEQIGIEQPKLAAEGKRLIRLFCTPRKPTKRNPATRVYPHDKPEEWERFKIYGIRDVDAEAEIAEFLADYPMREEEWETWFLDQEINDRGLPVDLELIDAAIEQAERERNDVLGQIKKLTKIENPNSLPQLKQWLNDNGCDIPNMQGDTIAEYAQRKYSAKVRKVLGLRLRIAKSSYTKYTKMRDTVCDDGRIRGTLQYLGASRTGRWAGRLIQPQNFIRTPDGYEPDDSINAILTDSVDANVMEHLAAALRGAIAAPGKHKIAAADLAGIEGRTLPWLCFDEAKLDKIRAGVNMYLLAAAGIYGKPYEQLSKQSPEYMPGKVAELALGYQGAVGALNQMAGNYGLPEYGKDEGGAIVRGWRNANQPIVKFWKDAERAARAAILKPEKEFPAGRLTFVVDGEFLWMRLPGGRCLYYHLPELDDDNRITYMGWNSFKRKWERIQTYGGKLVENATQAVARDVLVHGMHLAAKHGFLIVGSVHDEILTEMRRKTLDHKALIRCMVTLPNWAEGLPLAASGYTEQRYKKD